MILKTWNFAKRKNSTKQPTGASRDYTVYLKENASIERPVFILGTGIDAGVNYCQAMGNYYFIDDIVHLTVDQVELQCSLDVLATHKTEIGAYTAYIDRAASAHNSYIIDSALSAEQDIVSESLATTDLFSFDATGSYIVRTVSPGTSVTGVTSWVMSESDINTLLDFITTESNFPDVLTDSIVKSFFNPFQYILSIRWFPVSKNDIAGSSETLNLGWWSVGTFKKLTSALFYDNITINKPTNYYAQDFRAYTPAFTRLLADIPVIGVVELDPLLLDGTIRARVCIDWITGEFRITFGREGTQGGITTMTDAFTSYTGVIGINITVGQSDSMGGQILSAGQGMGIAEAAASGLVGGIADILSGIKNVLHPTTSVIGSSGNKASIISNPRLLLYIRNYGCSEFPVTVYGRPLRANRQISTLSGYIRCMAASIELAAPDSETDEVNRYLNGGFYYECTRDMSVL